MCASVRRRKREREGGKDASAVMDMLYTQEKWAASLAWNGWNSPLAEKVNVQSWFEISH